MTVQLDHRECPSQVQMSPVLVVIADILIQQPSQMSPIQHDHMIQEVSTYTANPAFRHSVLPRTSECGSNRLAALWFIKTKRRRVSMQEALSPESRALHGVVFDRLVRWLSANSSN